VLYYYQLLASAASTDGPTAYAVTAIPPVIAAIISAQIFVILVIFYPVSFVSSSQLLLLDLQHTL
jgi:hypothetical protein